MVKIISAVALIFAAAVSNAQAAYVLSSGQLRGTHTVGGVSCSSSTPYTTATQTLKAGQVFCSYLSAVNMSLCQCHQADVTAKNLDGFTADILKNIVRTGICKDQDGDFVSYANDGTWINGFYQGNSFMSAAGFSNGKVSSNGCKPVGCSHASQGLGFRDLTTVSTTC